MITVGMVLSLGLGTVLAQSTPDPLRSGFANPPQSAGLRVWWHWMNGNITKEGIKLDLEWMHSVGVVGFQNFNAMDMDTSQVVAKRLPYMSPERKDAFKYAITLGDPFGMEMAVAGSPGWSESGGPWVPAAQGMKEYVWSETDIEGGRPFTGKLQHLPTVTGTFQDMIVRHQPLSPGVAEPQFSAEYPFGQLHTFARFRAVLKCRDEHERIGCSEAEAEPDGSRTSGL